MLRIVECVPNFSEGRRKEVVDQIVAAISAVPGVMVLDVEMDQDHNRSVVTMAGEPAAVEEAAFQATRIAAQLIDLDVHRGEHPRIGATDVIPFVPIAEVTMEECVQMARRLGERIAQELSIPVYLYEKAAIRPERQDLANIRRGEYEALKEEIATRPDREPDFGPRVLGKAGATVVGARDPLIAFNVYLGAQDIEVAQKAAEAARNSSGGLRYVKALGMEIAKRNLVQVSMNLTNYQATPLHRALELVRREAERFGVAVVSTEIVGLVPREALLAAATYYLQLENFSPEQVLEQRLAETIKNLPEIPSLSEEKGLVDFLQEVASPAPTPGGGSVAALSAALAASLLSMVFGISLPKTKEGEVKKELEEALAETQRLGEELTALINEDATAYQAVIEAQNLPKGKGQDQAVQQTLRGAATVPLTVAHKSVRLLGLAGLAAEKGRPSLASDAASAGYMAQAAVSAASANVLTNLEGISDPQVVQAFHMQLDSLQKQAESLMDTLEDKVAAKMMEKQV